MTRASETARSESAPTVRRGFLHGVCVASAALTPGTGFAAAAVSDDPSIDFPDGTALVLENTRGPMEAAVRTENVHMPNGGWVGISTDADASNIIGRSMKRLPVGHFEHLMVAVRAQEPGAYTLYATLFEGGRGATFPGEGPIACGPTQDTAEILFD